MRSLLFRGLALKLALVFGIFVLTASFRPPLTALKYGGPSPVQLTINGIFNGVGDNSTGTFTSSGFLNSSGSTVEQVRINAQTFHAQTTFTDSHGSFTAKTNGQYVFIASRRVSGTGNWVIINGTGDYKTLAGTGDMSFTADFEAGTINEEWTGDMLLNKSF